MTALSRRHLLLGGAALASAATLAACSSDEDAPATAPSPDGGQTSAAGETSPAEAPATVDDITVGYIEDGNGCMLVAIAEEQGLWEKHGLNANTLAFTNGPLQIQALGTGDLDFG